MRRVALVWIGLPVAAIVGACASSPTPSGDGVDVATPSATETSGPAPSASEGPEPTAVGERETCLMLYECGCNSGCVEIEAPRRGVREGDRVLVKTGGLKGKEVWVAKSKSAEGGSILTVQQRDPKDEVQVCRRLAPGNALGYVCAMDGLGPAHACSKCPAE